MERPQCPVHPGSRIWRDGYYGTDNHRRQRWKCVPATAGRHVFTEVLPRQTTDLAECDECEREFLAFEGQQGSRCYEYTVRQVTRALLAVAGGVSYREAGARARREGGPLQRYARRHPSLAMDWVEVFAPVVTQPFHRPTAPAVLLADSVRFSGRSPTGRQGGMTLFNVLGIAGYDAPGQPYLWRLVASPRETTADWVRLFQTMSGQPLRVVCDQGRAMMPAVLQAWPNNPPEVYLCEYHLRQHLDERLAADYLTDDPWHALARNAFKSVADWDALVAAVKSTRPYGSTASWLTTPPHNAWPLTLEDHVRRQLSLPGPPVGQWPKSLGWLESQLAWVKNAIQRRRYSFRNRERTNRLLLLMQAQVNREIRERDYATRIRKHCDTLGGRSPLRRQILDMGAWGKRHVRNPGSLR